MGRLLVVQPVMKTARVTRVLAAKVEGGGGTTNKPLNCPVLAQPILTPDFFIPAQATRYM